MRTGFKFIFLCFVTLVLMASGTHAQNPYTENLIPESVPVQASLSKAQMDSMIADSKRKLKYQWSITVGKRHDLNLTYFNNFREDFNISVGVLFGLKNKNYMLGIGPGVRYLHFNPDKWGHLSMDGLELDLVVSNRFFVPLDRTLALDFFFNTGILLIDIVYKNVYYTYTTYSNDKNLFVYPKDQLDIPVSGGMGVSFGEDKDVQVEFGYATNLYIPSLYLSRINYLTFGVNVSF
jgi:hypothetical protein